MTTLSLQTVPVRYVVVLMIFLGNVFNYVLRVNINITLVAMVNHTALPKDNDTRNNQCGGSNSTAAGPSQEDGPFVWDEAITGEILAAFFYGYICTQIIGGRLAELVSAKHMFGVPILLASILSLLLPLTANYNWRLLVGLRVVMGVVMGAMFPASTVLLTSWIPVEERNLLVVLAQGSTNLGCVISIPMSTAILTSLGWEAVFYIEAGLAMAWFLLWILLVSTSPAAHWFISDAERRLIAEGVGPQVSTTQPPLPWRQMLTSLPLWAYLFGYLGTSWTYYTLLSELPQYFSSILGEDLSSNTLFNSLPYLGVWAFTLLYGWVSDKLEERGMIRYVTVPRGAMVFSCLVPGLLLAVIGFLGCNTIAIESLLVLTLVLQGASFSLGVLPMNMAPNFAGTIAGMGNTIASVPGFLGPLVVAALTEGHNNADRWRDSFLVVTAVCVVSSLMLLLGVSVEEQPWNRQLHSTDHRQTKASLDCPREDTLKMADRNFVKDTDNEIQRM